MVQAGHHLWMSLQVMLDDKSLSWGNHVKNQSGRLFLFCSLLSDQPEVVLACFTSCSGSPRSDLTVVGTVRRSRLFIISAWPIHRWSFRSDLRSVANQVRWSRLFIILTVLTPRCNPHVLPVDYYTQEKMQCLWTNLMCLGPGIKGYWSNWMRVLRINLIYKPVLRTNLCWVHKFLEGPSGHDHLKMIQ